MLSLEENLAIFASLVRCVATSRPALAANDADEFMRVYVANRGQYLTPGAAVPSPEHRPEPCELRLAQSVPSSTDRPNVEELRDMLYRLPVGDDLAASFVRVVLNQPRFASQLDDRDPDAPAPLKLAQ